MSIRDRVSGLSRRPVLRPLQHPDGVQQAGPGLQEAPAGGGGVLAVLAGVDGAPAAGLEQLQSGGGRDQLFGDVDREIFRFSLVHHLSVRLLSGPPSPRHGLLLWPPAVRRQTGGWHGDNSQSETAAL